MELLRAAAKDRLDKDVESQWVLRRFGYTKEENPDSKAGLLALPSATLVGEVTFPGMGTYTVSQALKVIGTAVEAFPSLGLPQMLLLDDLAVVKVLREVLADVVGVRVSFYQLLSEEEKEEIAHHGNSI